MHDALAMLAAHESPHDVHLVIIDDDPAPRELDPGWPRQRVIRTPVRRRRRRLDPTSAMVAATITGLLDCRDHGVDLALKLDTDAAIIAPFAEQLHRVLQDPQLGVVGSYDRTSSGGVRDWSAWDERLARSADAWQAAPMSDGSRRVRWYKRRSERRTVARLRAQAARHAPPGAHCLGGAYAVSRAFLERAELDWRPWVGTRVSEDVVVGILCAAAGLRMCSLVEPGEPFALAWKGLPGAPAEIAAAGHSIVHSVKAPTLDEERRLRSALSASPSAR